MSNVRFSAPSTAPSATSITVNLGGAPAVGDLVLVWLGLSNQIVVQPPGYNGTNQWFKAGGVQGLTKSCMHAFYHTWNASNSGSSVTFTFSPAPALGVGDTDLSTANAVAVAVVVSAGPAILDLSSQGTPDGVAQPQTGVVVPPVKRVASSFLVGAYSASGGSWSASDGTPVLATATLGNQVLSVLDNLNPIPAGYSPTLNQSNPGDLQLGYFTLSDNGAQVYNPPILQESPVAEDNALFVRYKLTRFYTVLNNSGIFSAVRYQSTDQIAAATQVFTNNQPVTSTDRTNLLSAGVGGDFAAVN